MKEVTVGSTVELKTSIRVPDSVLPQGSTALVTLTLEDFEGSIWSTASPQIQSLTQLQGSTRLVLTASITLPDSIPVDEEYQVIWECCGYRVVEDILVIPPVRTTTGVPHTFSVLDPTFIFELPTAEAALQLYKGNQMVDQTLMTGGTPLPDGVFQHRLTIDMIASLNPVIALWKCGAATYSSNVWMINPSILSVAHEVNDTLNRMRRTCRLAEMEFRPTDLIQFLKLGMDRLNAVSPYSDFTLTSAASGLRHYWLLCAQVSALRTRFLEEAETAFNFSGQAITLDFDITGQIESLASTLDQQINDGLPLIKRALAVRGVTTGDGSILPTVTRTIGAVGISASPVSGRYPIISSGFPGIIAIRR